MKRKFLELVKRIWAIDLVERAVSTAWETALVVTLLHAPFVVEAFQTGGIPAAKVALIALVGAVAGAVFSSLKTVIRSFIRSFIQRRRG